MLAVPTYKPQLLIVTSGCRNGRTALLPSVLSSHNSHLHQTLDQNVTNGSVSYLLAISILSIGGMRFAMDYSDGEWWELLVIKPPSSVTDNLASSDGRVNLVQNINVKSCH